MIWGSTISACVPVVRGPISAGPRRDKAPGNASEFMTRDTKGLNLRRLVPGDLRWRLAGWVALVVLLASAVTFLVFYVRVGAQGHDPDFSSDARTFVLAGVLTLLGALVGAWLIGTRLSRPLRRMAEVAARVDAGDLHPRIHVVSSEAAELRVLADAFNHMLDRLTEAFAGQRAFVADASHELRTPLTVISGQLEVLAAQSQPSEPEVRRVERLVQAEITRITRLVDDLLLLAKAEQTEFLQVQPIELPEYVRELWDGMSLVAVRRFELGKMPHGVLSADPDRLAQALRNLIANAIEHTAEVEGLVRLDVEDLGGGWVCFAVEDDGPGIDPQECERVFDRFHRTDTARDRASGGAGLGLAIVRAIAQAHGGHVTAMKGHAHGARIELKLTGLHTEAPGTGAVGDPLVPRSAPAH